MSTKKGIEKETKQQTKRYSEVADQLLAILRPLKWKTQQRALQITQNWLHYEQFGEEGIRPFGLEVTDELGREALDNDDFTGPLDC